LGAGHRGRACSHPGPERSASRHVLLRFWKIRGREHATTTKIVDKEDPVADELERVSMDEVEAESATSLPNKEVLSLLDVNANVDLGLDLAAPVDLAAAANLNVAAPIEAAASANVLSPDGQVAGEAQQQGSITQVDSGAAHA